MLADGPIADALALFRQLLEQRFGPRLLGLTLFGSHARGEAGPDSDVDVLVLVDELSGAERRAIYELGGEVYVQTMVAIAPLAMTQYEHEEMIRLERLLVQDIEREGVAL